MMPADTARRPLRDSDTFPCSQSCTDADREHWIELDQKILKGPSANAFRRALVTLVSSLISPETGAIRRIDQIHDFFDPDFPFPNERMFLLHFVDQVAHHDPTIEVDSTTFDIPRKVWEAFLRPVSSNFYPVTSFHVGVTPAGKIKPVLEQLGLATSNQEVYDLQHRFQPILASQAISIYRAPMFTSIMDQGETLSKAFVLQQKIGSMDVSRNFLIVLALSHFADARQAFLQDWSDTLDAEQLSAAAIQQFWVTRDPRHGLTLLVIMLLRHYYVFGQVVSHTDQPSLSEDLSPDSYFLLGEAASSFASIFRLEGLLLELFPRFKLINVKMPVARCELWQDYWLRHLPIALPHHDRDATTFKRKGVFDWWKLCVGVRREVANNIDTRLPLQSFVKGL